MTHPNWNRAKEIFQEAIEKTGPDRARYVAAACATDGQLRAQVEALLAAHDEAGDFLAMATTGANAAAMAAATVAAGGRSEGPGSRIGPYKLLQLIGEGGFGAVYMAEQDEPIHRRVALKIIKLGMDTKQVIARFESERQALAMMDHPNIAKVLDAGTTESGRPYFVMELVKGVTITEYCDANRLNTRERLDLFVKVCQAVHHAHEKGIIHRDIKPSNVMVTLHDATPVPKIIDFGVAKATNQRLTEKTLFTAYGACIGTPTYMSPEQAEMSGLEVDRRSDIYSLGVLLYELLTGTTPFDAEALRSAAFVELLRIIREEDPPTPSARLSTLGDRLIEVATNRHADPLVLTKLVRGDLDWIVMKAIEKDRTRRYDSASDLVADVSRYFKDEPVTARRPSPMYRLRKFATRRRAPLAAAAGIGGALVLGGGLAQILGLRSQEAASAAVRDVDGPSVSRLEFPADYWDGGSVALSPDGGRMAFIEESIGLNVAVYDLATKRTSLVTRLEWSGPASTEYPVWSPDGKTLAYMRSDEVPGKERGIDSIYVSTLGGSSRVVYRNDANPGGLVMPTGWLTDGSAIVAVLQGKDTSYSIGLIPAAGGAFQTLRTLQGRFDPDDGPSVSPDGRFIVFAEGPEGSRDIRVVSTDGQTGGVITDHPANDTDPRWSPDGRQVVFLSQRAGSTGLWSVAVENGRPAGDPVLVKDGMQDVALLNWAAHGLLYVRNVSVSDVFTLPVDPATGEALGKPEQIRFPRTGRNDDATWSPDGKYLAFVSAAERTQRQLVVLPAGGGTPREFPIPTTKYVTYRLWDLRWLPDGSGLGFSGLDDRERHVMFRLTLATGQWTTWPLPVTSWTRTTWTGAEAIVYAARGHSRQLIQYDLKTGQGRPLYVPANASEGVFRSLRFSPDRRLLAVGQSDDVGRSSVDIVDVATGQSRRVVRGVGSPAWSPDEKWLITTGAHDANESHSGFGHALHVLPVADGPPRRLFPNADASGARAGSAERRPRLSSPEWSPDGKRILFVMGRHIAEAWLMENVVPPGAGRR